MTTAQYREALAKLGLPPHGKDTAAALGLALRMLAYYASGERKPSRQAVRILELMLELRRQESKS